MADRGNCGSFFEFRDHIFERDIAGFHFPDNGIEFAQTLFEPAFFQILEIFGVNSHYSASCS
jgi:hypothetical protein